MPYFKNINYAPNVPFYPGRPPIFVPNNSSPDDTYYSNSPNQFQIPQNIDQDRYSIGIGVMATEG